MSKEFNPTSSGVKKRTPRLFIKPKSNVDLMEQLFREEVLNYDAQVTNILC